MSFCSQEEGGLPPGGDLPPGGVGSVPPGGSLYPEGGSASGGGGLHQGGGLPSGVYIQRGVCIGGGRGARQTPNWILGDTATSGRYASYWNAFLVSKNIISVQYKFKVQAISTNKCAKLTAVNTGTEVTDSGQVTPNSIGPFSRVTVSKKAL